MASLSILVVDDDRDHAESLGELFAIEGHDVEIAYSGEEAIAAYRRRHFDLGFMDVIMPGKSGMQSFLEIKQQTPGAQIFMVSGHSVEELLRQAADNGALGVLHKPIEQSNLIDAIAAARPSGLVVIPEDSLDLSPVLKDLVAAGQLNCKVASSSAEATDYMDQTGLDVLILDLDLPLVDSISVYSRLLEQGKAVPTLLITGSTGMIGVNTPDLGDVRCSGIVTKPFDPSALVNRLERLAVHPHR